jgi:hypothetical protein
MLSIIVLSVVLSVVILAFRAECRYTDGNYSEFKQRVCVIAAFCYAECPYIYCHYVECNGTLFLFAFHWQKFIGTSNEIK